MQPDALVAGLLAALERRDDLAEAGLLDPDCRIVVDTGDPSGAELRGRVHVASALDDLRVRHPDAAFATVHVNGAPGLALRSHDGTVVGVLVVDLGRDGTIRELWLSAAPGKLVHWNARRPAEG
ncbi:hypothetical protein [Agromyces mariniharenae]|uniref:SnoaL-like domain-containing protein n=1 Tax=Agromyces mariniharenae TaxID=2604423 RepID=A0A5S4V6K9_9MICO|nr:hypothetical protein [Agromyces mariniharenae]TYL52931.1 hypothetical protein FYC51_04150 [Agromyces mariniharenae]